MEIKLKSSFYGADLQVTADNVNISEDIQQNIYAKTEDGKTDFSRRLGTDIKTEYVDQIVNVLSDMIYYRKADYDSSSLIEGLFNKLPSSKAMELSAKLTKEYSEF